ncbi:hypothetical protein, partial [Klebsiella pneumoniae]|uniref:hypothetical protein n=1 Tax=Klebsiella pneumoniae TaxID=573 RepID=UPI0027302F3A
ARQFPIEVVDTLFDLSDTRICQRKLSGDRRSFLPKIVSFGTHRPLGGLQLQVSSLGNLQFASELVREFSGLIPTGL